jgi:uncharacterized integral membrane protein
MGVMGVVSVLALVLLFSRWNGSERVTVDVGVHTFHQVPLLYVAFLSLLLGMLVMLLAGLHSDLRIRRFLRERFEDEGREEGDTVDHTQRDLFLDDGEIPTFEDKRGEFPGGDHGSGPSPP